MKRILLLFLAVAAGLTALACESKPKLHVLNWGDYIDRDLVERFEDQYDVDVIYREVGSNEEMATLLQSGSSTYDIVVPSDYMIDKLVELELVQPLDFDLLPNYADLTVMPRLAALYEDAPWRDYVVPYAWGTLGILYDTTVPGLSDHVASAGWAALFDPAGTYDVGMYDSPRDAVAAALLYYGFDVNSTDEEELAMAQSALVAADYTAWGEDSLKSLVIGGTLDLALVYSGDYFSEYAAAVDEGRAVTFDYFVPDTTNVWLDAICIPTAAEDLTLAYRFIDFMLEYEHALQNSDYIGYAPPFQEVFDTMTTHPDYGYDDDHFDPYPLGATRQIYAYGSDARAEALVAILAAAKAG